MINDPTLSTLPFVNKPAKNPTKTTMEPYSPTPTSPLSDTMTPTNPQNNIITPEVDTISRSLYPNTPAPMIPTLPPPKISLVTTPPPMKDWGYLLDNISQDDDTSPNNDEQFLRIKKEIHDNRSVISSHHNKMQRLETEMHNLELKTNSTEQEEVIFLDKQVKMSTDLQECIKQMNEMKTSIHDLTKDKDTLFNKQRDLKIDISHIEDLVYDNDMEVTKILTDYKTSIAQLKYKQQEFGEEKRAILQTIESHNFKLNTKGHSPRSLWQNIPDIDQYPLIKSQMINHHASSFQSSLLHIALQGDRIAQIQNCYDDINSTIMITLSTNVALPEYNAHTPGFNYNAHLLLPTLHYQYIEAENVYK